MLGIFCVFFLLSYSEAQSYSYTPIEKKVKAAFLLKFSKYVRWPENAFSAPDAPLVIGVLGSDPFGDILDETMAGRTSGNRPVEVRRFKTAEQTEGCHLLFISRLERRRQAELLAALVDRPVLTVGDSDDFLEDGGCINIIRVGDNLRFEINQGACSPRGLMVSSDLLTLAKRVIRT